MPRNKPTSQKTGLVGTLSQVVNNPSIGVFLNDGTGAKLDYYLTNAVRVTEGVCQADGRRHLDVTVTMRYAAPATGLPTSVLGDGKAATPYVLQTNVLVFAPVGGGVVGIRQDNTTSAVMRGEDDSREVAQLTVRLTPGTTTVLTATVVAPNSADAIGQEIAPALVLSPGVQPWQISIAPYGACASSR